MSCPNLLKIPHVSPKIHPLKVKLEERENSINIEKNNNSLFMFLPFTPTPSRDARTYVFVCICERGGERVNLEKCRPGLPTLARVVTGWPSGTTRPPVALANTGQRSRDSKFPTWVPCWQWGTRSATVAGGMVPSWPSLLLMAAGTVNRHVFVCCE